jgi:prolyl-tRNA editing enzyme YbaK/EbsC (Cys-tRNA(Pro) deacylase)
MATGVERFLEVAGGVLGRPIEVRTFPEGTRTAEDAARAVGCDVAQIVKSLVFMADDAPVLALTSGANRVDTARLAEVLGARGVRRADADEARAASGFAIGGTPPFGHPAPVRTVLDPDLLAFGEIWAAAGAADAVFALTPSELRDAAGATVAAFREERPDAR